jgi:hypothetical protein
MGKEAQILWLKAKRTWVGDCAVGRCDASHRCGWRMTAGRSKKVRNKEIRTFEKWWQN